MIVFFIIDIILGFIFLIRNNAPWWAYLLFIVGNIIVFLICAAFDLFDK